MRVAGVLAGVLLVACAGGPEAEAPSYSLAVDVHDLMVRIVYPASDVVWDSAGAIITAAGETDLAPTTEEGWEKVVDNAAIVAESGNLLMLAGRSQGPAWDAYSRSLVLAGQGAMAAAAARDADALFDAGGEIYVVCRACHAQYLIPEDDPEGGASP